MKVELNLVVICFQISIFVQLYTPTLHDAFEALQL